MPYVHKICSACDRDAGERYHNMRKCPGCGQPTLVAATPFHAPSSHCTRAENLALRREVNRLRKKLGMGIKYREWSKER